MTKPFAESEVSKAPDYSNLNSWIAHPEIKDSILSDFYPENIDKLKADVFYIYPTLITDKKNNSWNANIYDKKQNDIIRSTAIQYQASAWAKAGKIYSPIFRQAHYRIFFEMTLEKPKIFLNVELSLNKSFFISTFFFINFRYSIKHQHGWRW